MLFYRINLKARTRLSTGSREARESLAEAIQSATDFNAEGKGPSVLVSKVSKTRMTCIGTQQVYSRKILEELTEKLIAETGIKAEIEDIREITATDFVEFLKTAERNSFIEDADTAAASLGIGKLYEAYYRNSIEEELIPSPCTEEEAIRLCRENRTGTEGLEEEIIRIFSTHHAEFEGHPVHYALFYGDDTERKTIRNILLSALYSAGRLRSRRIAHFSVGDDERSYLSRRSGINDVYPLLDGGTMVLEMNIQTWDGGGMRTAGDDIIEETAKLIAENAMDVLCILEFRNKDRTVLEKIRSYADDIQFITISEAIVSKEGIMGFLSRRAERDGITDTGSLFSMIPDMAAGYYPDDLLSIYRKWRKKRLCTEVYPQYSRIFQEKKIQDEPKGSAYDNLREMIGLKEAKETILQAIDYMKAEKLFHDSGLAFSPVSRHMVFTGNPGTAKTTVARLFAQIMKENGILSEGTFIEVGRKDIVSKYLGGTAPLVQSFFKRAEGGVLFIDEAYSLTEGEQGLYGDEAINTIVQEMENNRADTIVIFAGYPEEMERFISRNPGLRSRISFHIHFPDYSADELLDIFRLFAGKEGFLLSGDAIHAVSEIFTEAVHQKDFGNGRFARNIFEKAKMRHASRIVRISPEGILPPDMVRTITAEDIVTIDGRTEGKEGKRIGFRL